MKIFCKSFRFLSLSSYLFFTLSGALLVQSCSQGTEFPEESIIEEEEETEEADININALPPPNSENPTPDQDSENEETPNPEDTTPQPNF